MNMSHEEIQELLPDFVSGTLSPDAQEIIQKHLDSCPECGDEAGLIREMLDMAVPDPGGEFWKTLPSLVRTEDRRSRRTAGSLSGQIMTFVAQMLQPLPAAAAAALAVLVFAVSSVQRQDLPEPFFRSPLAASALDYDDLEEGDIPAVPIRVPDAETYLQSGRFNSASYLRDFAALDREELAELERMLARNNHEGG